MESITDTLLEEWQWRRECLNRSLDNASLFATEQIRVLDYLIHRYGDLPEARRPAPPKLKSDLQVDDRAIVVLHHVWKGKVGGVKTKQEAQDRITAILNRISSYPITVTEEGDTVLVDKPDADPTIDPQAWKLISRDLEKDSPVLDSETKSAIKRNPYIPYSVIVHLYRRILKPAAEDVRAAELLIRGRNRAAFS